MNSSFKLIFQDGFGEMLCCSQWGSFTQTWKCLLLGSWKKSRQKIKIHCVLKTSHQGLSKACLILISNIKLQLNILYCAQVCHQKGRTSEMGNISDRKILSLGKLQTRKIFTFKEWMECVVFYTYPNSPVSLCWRWCDQQRTASVMLKIK